MSMHSIGAIEQALRVVLSTKTTPELVDVIVADLREQLTGEASYLRARTTWHHPECQCGECQTKRYLQEQKP